MLKSHRNRLMLLVLLFILILKLNSAAQAQGPCVVPTITGNPTFTVDWSAFQWHPDNPEQVARDDSITVSVLNGEPYFTWQISGNDFWFDPSYTVTSIVNGGRYITIYAGPNACGSATITVTDSSEEKIFGSVREPNLGMWMSQGSWNAVIPTSGYAWDCLCGQTWDSMGCRFDVVWCKGKCCCYFEEENFCNLQHCCNAPVNANNFYALGMTDSVVWGTFVDNIVEHKNLALIENPNAYNCDNAPYNWSWPPQAKVDGQNPPCSPGECGAIIGSDCVTGGTRDRGKPIGVRRIWAYKYVCQ